MQEHHAPLFSVCQYPSYQIRTMGKRQIWPQSMSKERWSAEIYSLLYPLLTLNNIRDILVNNRQIT